MPEDDKMVSKNQYGGLNRPGEPGFGNIERVILFVVLTLAWPLAQDIVPSIDTASGYVDRSIYLNLGRFAFTSLLTFAYLVGLTALTGTSSAILTVRVFPLKVMSFNSATAFSASS